MYTGVMKTSIFNTLFTTGLVPVVKIEDSSLAPDLGKALMKGGIPVAEVTFRTSTAAESIRAMVDQVPGLLVGAGTVINVEMAKKALQAGAAFVVSPGFNPKVVEYCLEHDMPIVPGINNPTGIEQALNYGLDFLKFFPAEPSGGVQMLDALSAPYNQVRFMPTGGIGLHNLEDYAKRSYVHAIGGSWMVPPSAIEKQDWDAISTLCRDGMLKLQGFDFGHLGINSDNPNEAADIVKTFELFGFSISQGVSSYFINREIEIMKSPYLGSRGHIAIRTNNVRRAGEFLGKKGFTPKEETAKTNDGKLIALYLEPEVAGFALHLLQK